MRSNINLEAGWKHHAFKPGTQVMMRYERQDNETITSRLTYWGWASRVATSEESLRLWQKHLDVWIGPPLTADPCLPWRECVEHLTYGSCYLKGDGSCTFCGIQAPFSEHSSFVACQNADFLYRTSQ